MEKLPKRFVVAAALLFTMLLIFTFSACDTSSSSSSGGTTPAPVDPGSVDDGYHQQRMQFVNIGDKGYLTAAGTSSGAAIIAESGSSTRNQWLIQKAGSDYYRIVNASSGNVLAPAANTAVTGAALVATANPSGNTQYWKLSAVSTDGTANGLYYTILNYANTGLAVTLSNGDYILSSKGNTSAQRFLFNAYGAEGFAGYCTNPGGSVSASVTGGVLGSVVYASNVSQLQYYASGATPYTIVINSNISASLLTKVNVGKNKTFIGSYNAHKLNNIHFRCISDSGNIIFKNITFSHSSAINANDDIQVYISDGNKFWLDHCTFTGHSGTTSSDVDKFIYVGLYADHVSVTACWFGIHKYGLILGYYDDNASRYTGYPKMTIANSYFNGTLTRAPGLMRYGYFHCYNNFVYDFALGYTVYTRSNVYSENNYFDKGRHNGSVLDVYWGVGAFADSGSVLSSQVVGVGVPTTSWRPATNYAYNVRTAAEAPAWCKNYAGSRSSSPVYSVDSFSNEPDPGDGDDENDTFSGTYSILALHSGKALDVWAWGTVDGTNIVQYDFWGGDSQKFVITPVSGIWHRITPVIATDQAVDISGCVTSAGANIQTWTYWGGDCQQWRFERVADGQHRIIARNSGLCMDVYGASQENGANVIQSTCLADGVVAHQTFQLVGDGSSSSNSSSSSGSGACN